MKTDPRKKSLLVSTEIAAELRAEAARLKTPISRVAQQAWRIAREHIRSFPSAPGYEQKGQC